MKTTIIHSICVLSLLAGLNGCGDDQLFIIDLPEEQPQPVTPNDPVDSGEPATPVEPIDDPYQPVVPIDPNPNQPVDPNQPIEPDQPDQPIEPDPDPDPEPETMCGNAIVQSLLFEQYGVDRYKGASATPNVIMTTDQGTYQLKDNSIPCELQWTSNNNKIATVDNTGKITAKGYGKAILTVQTIDGKFHSDFVMHVINPDVLGRPITKDMIFANGFKLKYNSVMQGFDIASNGMIYFTQNGNGTKYRHLNAILRIDPTIQNTTDKKFDAEMSIAYAGHGQNVSLEEANDGHYIWVGNYGSRDSENLYRGSQTISRFAYAPNKTLKPSQIAEHYTYPNRFNFYPALDIANDRFALWSQTKGAQKGYVDVFKLSEARALTPKSQKLTHEITWGGGTSDMDPSKTERPTIQAKDLSTLTPTNSLNFPQSGFYTDYNNQGFAISNGLIYILRGSGNKADGKDGSSAKVTVATQSGKGIKNYTLPDIGSAQRLKELGITTSGFMEPEGIRVIDGYVYIGFAMRYLKSVDSNESRRVVILRYNLMQE